jgi:hypothetical protein
MTTVSSTSSSSSSSSSLSLSSWRTIDFGKHVYIHVINRKMYVQVLQETSLLDCSSVMIVKLIKMLEMFRYVDSTRDNEHFDLCYR